MGSIGSLIRFRKTGNDRIRNCLLFIKNTNNPSHMCTYPTVRPALNPDHKELKCFNADFEHLKFENLKRGPKLKMFFTVIFLILGKKDNGKRILAPRRFKITPYLSGFIRILFVKSQKT